MKPKNVILAVLAILVFCIVGCGENRVGKAEKAFSVKDYKTATTLLAEELKDCPDSARAHFLLGKVKREKGDPDWGESFTSAIAADKAMGPQVKEYLMNRKGSCHDDLYYLDDKQKDLVKDDQAFDYRFLVKDSMSEYQDAEMYAKRYPEDEKGAPEAYYKAACGYYFDERTHEAHGLFKACLKYPKSEYCRKAKAQLADYWDVTRDNLYLKGDWQGWPVRAGQEYRYEITGANVGHSGYYMDGDHLWIFVGTREELNSNPRMSPPTAGNSGSGKASHDGAVWIRPYTCDSGYDGCLPVKLEFKRMSD